MYTLKINDMQDYNSEDEQELVDRIKAALHEGKSYEEMAIVNAFDAEDIYEDNVEDFMNKFDLSGELFIESLFNTVQFYNFTKGVMEYVDTENTPRDYIFDSYHTDKEKIGSLLDSNPEYKLATTVFGDNGYLYLSPGYHFANRDGYMVYITDTGEALTEYYLLQEARMNQLMGQFLKLMPETFMGTDKGEKIRKVLEQEKDIVKPTLYLVNYLFIENQVYNIDHGADVFFSYDVALAYCEHLASTSDFLKSSEFKYSFDTGIEEPISLEYEDEEGNKEHIYLNIIQEDHQKEGRTMLKTIIDEVLNKDVYGYPVKRIGTSIYITLDKDKYVKAYFDIHCCASQYEVLCLSFISKTSGIIDTNKIHFKTIFDNINDDNKLHKHIWDNNNKVAWYGRPTWQDLDNIVNTVKDYINVMK